jgi:hypothetical protein
MPDICLPRADRDFPKATAQASIVGNEDGEMWVYGWPRPASASSACDMPITPRKAAAMLSVHQMK